MTRGKQSMDRVQGRMFELRTALPEVANGSLTLRQNKAYVENETGSKYQIYIYLK